MTTLLSMQGVFALSLLYVAVNDFYYQKIPNLVSIFIAVLGLIYNFNLLGCAGLIASLYGLTAGLLVGLFFYRFTGLGAGDVKLMAAIGCFVGSPTILIIIAYSYIASAVLGIIYLCLRYLSLKRNNKQALVGKSPEKLMSLRIPMAPGISLSAFYVLLSKTF